MTAVSVSPTQFSKPPPTGWLPLVLHAIVAGVGAVLAFMGALGTVTGSAPRVVAIGAGAVIFLGAFLGYLTAHSKAAAADEARAIAWAHAHMPDAVAAYKLAEDAIRLLPPNLRGDLAAVQQTASQALQLVQQVGSAPAPATDAVVAQAVPLAVQKVLAALSSAAAPAAPPGPAQEPPVQVQV